MKSNIEKFVHLKVRSHYSILEGSTVSDIVSAAENLKMPAIALTDNSNVFGAMEFTKLCLNKGIQPIIGCLLKINIQKSGYNTNNVITQDSFTVTLLVKDYDGWKNLSILISKAYYNYKVKGKKSVNIDDLNNYGTGLICLFNDLVGLDKNESFSYKENKSIITSLNKIFQNRYYFELFRDNSEKITNKENILHKTIL